MWLARLSWPRYALVILAVASVLGLVGGILWGRWWFGVPLAAVIVLAMLYCRAEIRFALGADRPRKPEG